jgi:hypothetical protein
MSFRYCLREDLSPSSIWDVKISLKYYFKGRIESRQDMIFENVLETLFQRMN